MGERRRGGGAGGGWDQSYNHLCVKFDVYINAPEHGDIGPGCSEFSSSFVNVPHMKRTGGSMMVKTKLRLGITC